MTTRPEIGSRSSEDCMLENAASSALSWLPAPRKRALARAARSVDCAYSSQRQARPCPPSAGEATADRAKPLGAREHEVHDLADARVEARVLDHRHLATVRPVDDVALHAANLVELLDIASNRTEALCGRVPNPEVARVNVLALDLEHALHCEGALHRRQ